MLDLWLQKICFGAIIENPRFSLNMPYAKNLEPIIFFSFLAQLETTSTIPALVFIPCASYSGLTQQLISSPKPYL